MSKYKPKKSTGTRVQAEVAVTDEPRNGSYFAVVSIPGEDYTRKIVGSGKTSEEAVQSALAQVQALGYQHVA